MFIELNAINIIFQASHININQLQTDALEAIAQLIKQSGKYEQIIAQIPGIVKNDVGMFTLFESISEISKESCIQLLQIGVLDQVIMGCQQNIIQAWQTLQNFCRFQFQELQSYGIENILMEGLRNQKYQIVVASLLSIGFISSQLIDSLMSLNVCKNIIRVFEVNMESEVIVAACAFSISCLSKESSEAADIFSESGILLKFYQLFEKSENLKNSIFKVLSQICKSTTLLDPLQALTYQVTDPEIQKIVIQQISRALSLNVENRRNFLKSGGLEFLNKNFKVEDIEDINRFYSKEVIAYCRNELDNLIQKVK